MISLTLMVIAFNLGLVLVPALIALSRRIKRCLIRRKWRQKHKKTNWIVELLYLLTIKVYYTRDVRDAEVPTKSALKSIKLQQLRTQIRDENF